MYSRRSGQSSKQFFIKASTGIDADLRKEVQTLQSQVTVIQADAVETSVQISNINTSISNNISSDTLDLSARVYVVEELVDTLIKVL